MKNKMQFERNAGRTLDRVRETFTQRGSEYSDTWKETRWLNMLAVARHLGIALDNDSARKLAAAGLCDVKYWRMLGGYKDDTVIDRVAYDANLCAEMENTLPPLSIYGFDKSSPATDQIPREDYVDSWMQTYSGLQFFPARPEDCAIEIIDIAQGLANECRFGGHCKHFYSVAQHCVLGSYQVPHEHALTFLMHDATEAYLKDQPRALKDVLGDTYRKLERNLWMCIAEKFRLPHELPGEVKIADQRMLATERRALFIHPSPAPWEIEKAKIRPYDGIGIEQWSADWAATKFLRRFQQLTECKPS